jgi:NADPH:quinone reductase-like Zn-dependent oxidoreductase
MRSSTEVWGTPRAPAFSRSVPSCVAAPEGVDANVQFMTVTATKMPFVDGVIPMKVLVTGGTSGLGLAMASALAAAGATVAVTGRSGARASGVAAELPGAVGIELDVRDESSVAWAVDQAWSRLGGIDMLVNTPGSACARSSRAS